MTPTIDRVFRSGDFSTVSDSKDNVHWFTSLSEGAFIFDLGEPRRVNDEMWVSRLTSREAYARYGWGHFALSRSTGES